MWAMGRGPARGQRDGRVNRLVIVDNRAIAIGALGDRSIHGNPTVRRFLDSLTLLRGGQ
jgi:hypothetical protein